MHDLSITNHHIINILVPKLIILEDLINVNYIFSLRYLSTLYLN